MNLNNKDGLQTIKSMLDMIREIGIDLDERNVQEKLYVLEMKYNIKAVIDAAKQCGLEINKDDVKTAITAVTINFDSCDGNLEHHLLSILESQSHSLYKKAIKTTPEFQQLLYMVGEAVDYRK
ncbi:hypothetical protein A3K86_03650 [Photobacterium jeanii]|uniref:Uncharacterized protein n=1 Tax=Photobacterium jeanii TaxID=858640 RepID=A0A178KLM1_9GAMM|nr:hypothetical protein [Photobacterium jeanii]OAN18026.1 hypothetical protein A3K86_03650 [Photobacterium jeanii]PST92305.1 hypothetical protein C9I91_03790 [Photobacterium jeanii]